MSKQIEAAHEFMQAHRQEVSNTKAALIKAAEHLLNQLGKAMFPPDELSQVTELCQNGDVHGLFRVFRPHSSVFVSGGQSGVFWDWIDGAGFLFDATGAQWPYMTQERRKLSLQWAQEGAQAVIGASYAG